MACKYNMIISIFEQTFRLIGNTFLITSARQKRSEMI